MNLRASGYHQSTFNFIISQLLRFSHCIILFFSPPLAVSGGKTWLPSAEHSSSAALNAPHGRRRAAERARCVRTFRQCRTIFIETSEIKFASVVYYIKHSTGGGREKEGGKKILSHDRANESGIFQSLLAPQEYWYRIRATKILRNGIFPSLSVRLPAPPQTPLYSALLRALGKNIALTSLLFAFGWQNIYIFMRVVIKQMAKVE